MPNVITLQGQVNRKIMAAIYTKSDQLEDATWAFEEALAINPGYADKVSWAEVGISFEVEEYMFLLSRF